MIHRRDISKAAAPDRVPEKSVEKDYVIHWLMAGLSRTAVHARQLFKGGTALRLCRFEGYRYSEDIDLTALEDVDKAVAFRAFRDADCWIRDASAVQAEVVEDSYQEAQVSKAASQPSVVALEYDADVVRRSDDLF